MEGGKIIDSIDSLESIESSEPIENMKNGEPVDRSSPCKNALIILLVSGPFANHRFMDAGRLILVVMNLKGLRAGIPAGLVDGRLARGPAITGPYFSTPTAAPAGDRPTDPSCLLGPQSPTLPAAYLPAHIFDTTSTNLL